VLDGAALERNLSASDPIVVRAVARLAISGRAARAAVARLQPETEPSAAYGPQRVCGRGRHHAMRR